MLLHVARERGNGMRYVGILGLSLVIAFASVVAEPSSAFAAEPLTADTAMAMAGGATFTAPTGWRVTTEASKNVLEPPEGDSKLVVVDVQAADAAAAVVAAWAAYRPESKRPLRVTTPQAPYNGWGERRGVFFENPPPKKDAGFPLAGGRRPK